MEAFKWQLLGWRLAKDVETRGVSAFQTGLRALEAWIPAVRRDPIHGWIGDYQRAAMTWLIGLKAMRLPSLDPPHRRPTATALLPS